METTLNERLLESIRGRQRKQTEFGYGITTADRYVQRFQDEVGLQTCYRYAKLGGKSFGDAMLKAAKTLVYANSDMVLLDKSPKTDGEIELPKNTLMAFTHVLTTPRKDRDGDVLRTEGAMVDPKMLLLWQHVHTLPIGKMLAKVEHNTKRLVLTSCIVDMNELCHDAAVMVDNDMARFSHGFRALEFGDLKEAEGDITGPPGYDIKRFEIMEESIVSVPANSDAQVLDTILGLVGAGKLTSPLMKAYGKQLKSRQPLRIPVQIDLKCLINGQSVNATTTLKEVESHEPDDETEDESAADGGDHDCDCPSEEASAGDAEGKSAGGQAATEHAEMSDKGHGITGSFEAIRESLHSQLKDFLKRTAGLGDEIDCWIMATLPKYVVVECHNYKDGKRTFWQIDYTMKDGEPVLSGVPQEVEIEVTTEVVEKSLHLTEKAGRVLSKNILTALKSILDDMNELIGGSMTRGQNALCERCIKKLSEVIKMGEVMEEEDEEEPDDTADEDKHSPPDVKQAIKTVLAFATADQLKTLETLIAAQRSAEQLNQKHAQYLAVLGRQ